jgi:hypothetical protein
VENAVHFFERAVCRFGVEKVDGWDDGGIAEMYYQSCSGMLRGFGRQ